VLTLFYICDYKSVMEEKCINCKYYSCINDTTGGNGLCRRYPPKPAYVVQDGSHVRGLFTSYSKSYFPEMEYDDWCGEFKSNKKKQAPAVRF